MLQRIRLEAMANSSQESCKVRCAILTALVMLSSSLAVLSVPCAGQQISSLRVRVIDAQGAAVSGAEVCIVGQPLLLGSPAPNGTFSFKGVPPGSYQVTATRCGLEIQRRPFVREVFLVWNEVHVGL